MSELRSSPWQKVGVDLCGSFYSDYLLAVTDEYSRYPEVEILQCMSATAIIPKLNKIFFTLGIPTEVKTDNSPPFKSSEYADFGIYFGFRYKSINSLWPQANAEAEHLMHTFEKTKSADHVEGHPWKRILYAFLHYYHTTFHCSIGMAPADVLFNRPVRMKLAESLLHFQFQTDVKLWQADTVAKNIQSWSIQGHHCQCFHSDTQHNNHAITESHPRIEKFYQELKITALSHVGWKSWKVDKISWTGMKSKQTLETLAPDPPGSQSPVHSYS